jgi:hypothetical protein
MSQNIEPLYISTGQPADGKNKFFPRTKVLTQIWRKLKRGEDLLIVAPRRVGKSSILRYMQRNPKEGYFVKYLSIMSVDNANGYFKQIFNSLLEDDEIYGWAKGYFTKSRKAIENLGKKVRGMSLDGFEFDSNEQIDYYIETVELLQSLPKEAKRIVFLLDEFPDTVSNIAKHSKEEATNFLQQNRDLRQEYGDLNIQFVLTGSIGLGNVVAKLNRKDINNDLTQVEVPPLNDSEAIELIDRLCLGLKAEDICLTIDEEVKKYLLQKIVWNIPYYIQMIIDELVDDGKEVVDKNDIDRIIDKIIKARSTADYFSNWKTRLRNIFEKEEELLAIKILSYISKNNMMEEKEMKKISEELDLKVLLEVLEYDGYINQNKKTYQFNSPLLKSWWAYRVAE